MNEKEVEEFNCPSCGVPLNVLISREAYKDNQTAAVDLKVEDVCQALPPDVLPNLNVALSKHSSPQVIHIVPKKFLGKENFYKVMEAVKAMRGEWASQGKHSYWWGFQPPKK